MPDSEGSSAISHKNVTTAMTSPCQIYAVTINEICMSAQNAKHITAFHNVHMITFVIDSAFGIVAIFIAKKIP